MAYSAIGSVAQAFVMVLAFAATGGAGHIIFGSIGENGKLVLESLIVHDFLKKIRKIDGYYMKNQDTRQEQKATMRQRMSSYLIG